MEKKTLEKQTMAGERGWSLELPKELQTTLLEYLNVLSAFEQRHQLILTAYRDLVAIVKKLVIAQNVKAVAEWSGDREYKIRMETKDVREGRVVLTMEDVEIEEKIPLREARPDESAPPLSSNSIIMV